MSIPLIETDYFAVPVGTQEESITLRELSRLTAITVQVSRIIAAGIDPVYVSVLLTDGKLISLRLAEGWIDYDGSFAGRFVSWFGNIAIPRASGLKVAVGFNNSSSNDITALVTVASEVSE